MSKNKSVSGFWPQVGPQEMFLHSEADIAIFGGAAGAGKTFALELESQRHLHIKGFTAVLLRRTLTQVTKTGGPWDESFNLYPHLGGVANKSSLKWTFPVGSSVAFGHIEHEKDLHSWDGSQIALILFDQLESFTERMFFYMLSRNRSICSVPPYVRASCNPDGSSWLAGFLSWWIDQDTGYPIETRSGVIRWMSRVNSAIHWHPSKQQAIDFCTAQGIDSETATAIPKSVAFFPATLDDNRILTKRDPGYKSNLLSLPNYDRNRLLGGNWKTRPDTGEFPSPWFDGKWFEKWPTESGTYLKTMALDPSKGSNDRSGDYQAIIKLLIGHDNILYVQANMRRRPIDQMVADTVDIYRQFRPHIFGLEGNAWQDLLAPDFDQQFKLQGIVAAPVQRLNNTVNKQVRIRRLGSYLAQNRVRFMANCQDTQILIDQLMDFPGGQYDDGPDAMEMAIRMAELLTNGSIQIEPIPSHL